LSHEKYISLAHVQIDTLTIGRVLCNNEQSTRSCNQPTHCIASDNSNRSLTAYTLACTLLSTLEHGFHRGTCRPNLEKRFCSVGGGLNGRYGAQECARGPEGVLSLPYWLRRIAFEIAVSGNITCPSPFSCHTQVILVSRTPPRRSWRSRPACPRYTSLSLSFQCTAVAHRSVRSQFCHHGLCREQCYEVWGVPGTLDTTGNVIQKRST
jgi:hypothetical protein